MIGLYSGSLPALFDRFKRLGFLVRISEASVAENNDPATQGSDGKMQARPAAIAALRQAVS